MAMFTRASTAYDDNGNLVAANVPRFNSSGLILKQSMTNLVSNGNFANSTDNWSSSGTILSVTSSFNASFDVIANGDHISNSFSNPTNLENHILYAQSRIKNTSNNASLYLMSSNGNVCVTQLGDGNYHTLSLLYTVPASVTYVLVAIYNSVANADTISVKYVNCFDLTSMFGAGNEPTKAQCDILFTEYVNGMQAAESLTIPATAFSKDEGGIELAFKLDALIKGSTLFYATNSGETFEFYINHFGTCVWVYNSANSNIVGSCVFSANTIFKIALFWSKAKSIKCAYVNGKIIGTQSFSGCPNSFNPSFFNVANATNGDSLQLKYLRCSNSYHESAKILTDSALYNLPVEADTTYKMDLQNNIGAAANPSVILTGLGSNIVSRNGAGIRNTEILGISGIRVDNTRKAFIDVKMGSQAAVITKRNGSGQRKAVISGIDAMKIIEPLITADLDITERQGETEVEGVPLVGNTVRITAKFHTFSGALADPTSITLTFYDFSNMQIGATVNITAANRVSAGVYLYDYVVPDVYRKIYYEFAGIQENERQAFAGHIDIQRVQNY